MTKPSRKRVRPARHRDVEVARTREDILMAAARALGRRGFGSVSMQDIAAEVGFTAPALYAYFPGKEEIFSALRAMLMEELAATFRPPPPAGLSFRRRLAILLGRQLEWADRRRDVFLAFAAVGQLGELPRAQLGAPGRSAPGEPHRASSGRLPIRPAAGRSLAGPGAHLRAMARWMGEAIEGPDDVACNPDDAACVLYGICHGFFLRWLLSGSTTRLADDTERILDFFFRGVSGAPRQPAGRGPTAGGSRRSPREPVKTARPRGASQSRSP